MWAGLPRNVPYSVAVDIRLLLAARSREKLELTAAKCREHTDTVITVVADVSQEEDCHRIVDTAGAEMGGVDILILNAAYSPVPSFFSDYKSPVSCAMFKLNDTKCSRPRVEIPSLELVYEWRRLGISFTFHT